MNTPTLRETSAGLRQDFGNLKAPSAGDTGETHPRTPPPRRGVRVSVSLNETPADRLPHCASLSGWSEESKGNSCLMNPTHQQMANRVDRLELAVAALKARRWRMEWPPGHMDAPPTPAHVLAFEERHGPAPGSAERVLEEFTRSLEGGEAATRQGGILTPTSPPPRGGRKESFTLKGVPLG